MIQKKIKKVTKKTTKPKNDKGKGTTAIYEMRISVIVKLMTHNYSTGEIKRHLEKNEGVLNWKVKERQIENYIKEATAFIKKAEKRNRYECVRLRHLQRQDVFKTARASGELMVALKALDADEKAYGDLPVPEINMEQGAAFVPIQFVTKEVKEKD